MLHIISLSASLFALWLVLSGFFEPMPLIFGAASSVFVVYIALRMDIADHEGHPVHLKFTAVIGYWLWLLKEIVIANLDVAKRILQPRPAISPVVIRLPASQSDDVGRVIYANSITLTPGTVAIDIREGRIGVHALTRAGAEQLAGGEMDRRVTALEPK